MAESLVCPGCGAMLPHPDLEGRSTCLACGRITDVEPESRADDRPGGAASASGPGAFTFTVTTGPDGAATTVHGAGGGAPGGITVPTTAGRTAKRAGVGCLIGVVALIGAISAGVVLLARSVTDTVERAVGSTSSVSPISGNVTVLKGAPGAVVDVVALTYEGSSDRRQFSRVSLATSGPQMRWRSADLPKDTYSAPLALAGDQLFAAVNDEVWALDAATGKRRWQAGLSDKVSGGCDSCFQVVRDTLVVQTSDGQVTAFGSGSAEPRWSRRLVSGAGHLAVAGDVVVVIDDAPTAGDPGQVHTIDPATGKVLHTATPTCKQPSTGWVVDLSASDLVAPVAGTGDLVALFASGEGCAVRWEARAGAVRWTAQVPGVGSVDRDDTLVTATDLVAGVSSGLARIDLGSGVVTALGLPADVSAVPRYVFGGVLVGETTSTRGTTKGGVAAWDLATGKVRWSNRYPDVAQPASRGSSDALFPGSPRSVLVAADGVSVVSFSGDARTVTVRTVDLGTGEFGTASTRPFHTRFDSGTPSLTVEVVGTEGLIVSLDSVVQNIPLSVDKAIATWPKVG